MVFRRFIELFSMFGYRHRTCRTSGINFDSIISGHPLASLNGFTPYAVLFSFIGADVKTDDSSPADFEQAIVSTGE